MSSQTLLIAINWGGIPLLVSAAWLLDVIVTRASRR